MAHRPLLVADPERDRTDVQPHGGSSRPVVEVAVGVLVRTDGAFLLTSRPEGKPYSGYWEFPGGKIEPGESLEEALRRELHEEIGLEIAAPQPWKTELVDYPHALVRLHFFKVVAWSGDLQMRESQEYAWEQLPVRSHPVLPGTLPVLDWFATERRYKGPTLCQTNRP